MADGTEPITDDELLYRRIPVSPGWYNPGSSLPPSPLAFRPRMSDLTGLSVHRAKYRSARSVAENARGSRYFVAVLGASDLRETGIEVVPRPLPGDPGHAELPALRSDNRKNTECLELQQALTLLCISIEGPYP
jgi:hypothetical protein